MEFLATGERALKDIELSCVPSLPPQSLYSSTLCEFPVAEITVLQTGRFPPAEDCSLDLLEAMSETGVSAGP